MKTLLVALITSVFTISANALVLFTEQSVFTDYTNASYLGDIPNAGGHTGPVVIGSATISTTPGNTLHLSGDVTPYVPGSDIAISGYEDLDFAFDTDMQAFGFGMWEPTSSGRNGCNAACYDSHFSISFYDGLNLLESFIFNVVDDTNAFLGFSLEHRFNRVEVRDLLQTIDNEFFGNLYAAEALIQDVPESGALGLLGLGLLGLVLTRRRIRAEVTSSCR